MDEPDTSVIEKMLDSDPPEAERLARCKLHAIAKKPTPSSFPAQEPPTLPDGKRKL